MHSAERVWTEDELLPISALQHLVFCERQCALIHLERLWADNPLTVEGSDMHSRVHDHNASEVRGDVRVARGIALRSFRLGLAGQADVVEFHRAEVGSGVSLPNASGVWLPFPVEYKRGRPKRGLADRVQLCAQALCLEEMLGVRLGVGALFYGRSRRRLPVAFDESLRSATKQFAERLHVLLAHAVTPRARREPKCKRCSLVSLCLPDAMAPKRSAKRYLASATADLFE
jgi:CRISPR-associated exonuclease Cas4